MAENRLVKTLSWFIGGAAIGAAVGLLYAPKAGEETREDVGDWLREKREQTRDAAARLKERFPGKKEQVVADCENRREKEPVAA